MNRFGYDIGTNLISFPANNKPPISKRQKFSKSARPSLGIKKPIPEDWQRAEQHAMTYSFDKRQIQFDFCQFLVVS